MIIVTGASSGIGKEVAQLLAEKTNKEDLILISRRNPEITNSNWLKCDLSDRYQLEDLAKKLKQKVSRLDFIVHCAGVMKSQSSSSLSIDDCVESFMVNTIAPLYITSSLSRQLAKAKGVAIVISSIASKLDIPGECIYSATKSGLDKGFETLSADLSRLGINFLKIHPVMIDTPMTSRLTDSQKEYMNQQRTTKTEPTAVELAKYIVGLQECNHYATGSSIYFGGIRR
ncbi:SDR family NAD(P)-dependent oxidoreductase [Nodularia spumigena CS-586/05]|uniref:SDR family oxidoreductase n=1 Tax=Nodularia spumigena TaxID=70799 RepID=UPI00232CFCCC|nr:SDR family oxidoreductase [Nodularia spumigena]MDB9343912.1 SDR family NAD(P)-dependent oxidoreductase [Nodularia spumigena CS-588/06]MDB9371640.1 SDR family NAD(P)-dependent oxidoreductase [Nodularia spumigena CS-586/05]